MNPLSMLQRKNTSTPSVQKSDKSWRSMFSLDIPTVGYDPNRTMMNQWKDYLDRKRAESKQTGSHVCVAQVPPTSHRAAAMTQRRSTPEKKGIASWFKMPEMKEEDKNKTFLEKWRAHVAERKKNGTGAAVAQNKKTDTNQEIKRNLKTGMRLLMCFQAPTQMWIFQFYIIPHFFDDYGFWTPYYLKVLSWFILINGLANWFCVILYDPSYRKTKDNPYLTVEKAWDQPPDQFVPLIQQASNGNGHCVYDMTSKEGLPWEFCRKCDMHVPPRAYHCNFCKACILKRDHHCFMVGNCIGFNNQRYFIVLAFYAMVTGCLGAYFTIKYVQDVYWPICGSWIDVLFPVAVYKSIFGSVSGFNALLTVHCYLEVMFGGIGFIYFSSQMTMSADGKTLFEVSKKIPLKVHNSINRNLKSVFGDCWVLNFLFPMTLIFRQRDDGVHWEGVKVDHNQNSWREKDDDPEDII